MNQQSMIAALKNQRIKTPSWGYGNSGTRFKTFLAAGTTRTVCAKLEAMVQSVVYCQEAHAKALHIDFEALAAAADVLEAHRQSDYLERVGAIRGTSGFPT